VLNDDNIKASAIGQCDRIAFSTSLQVIAWEWRPKLYIGQWVQNRWHTGNNLKYLSTVSNQVLQQFTSKATRTNHKNTTFVSDEIKSLQQYKSKSEQNDLGKNAIVYHFNQQCYPEN